MEWRWAAFINAASLILVLLVGIGPRAATTTQVTSTAIYRSTNTWYNESCHDLCACIEDIMGTMAKQQICMAVKGLQPCHLQRQVNKSSSYERCHTKMTGQWFECHQGATVCTGGMDNGCSTESKGDKNPVYLGCEYNMAAHNNSVTCIMTRDSDAVGQCVNDTDCYYKKERKSCPEDWRPLKLYCLKASEAADQRTWSAARQSCGDEANSSLLSIDSFETTEEVEALEKIFEFDQDVWLGLVRDNVSSPFRWIGDTDLLDDGDWPWAEDEPSTVEGHNHVYLKNKKLHTDKADNPHGYSCKLRVSKSLDCQDPLPTTTTTTTTTTTIPTTETPTTASAITTALTTGILTTVPTTAITTTAIQSTKVPRTAIPTTAIPTTEMPTTAISTTALPTTNIPTTEMPTTAISTTALPTTEMPTTAMPTTAIPTTAISTTAIPTTAIQTTAIQTTAIPTTAIPTTAFPTTAIPSPTTTQRTMRYELREDLKYLLNDTATVEALSFILSAAEPLGDTDEGDDTDGRDRSMIMIKSLDSLMDGLADSTSEPSEPIVISTPDIVLKVLTLCASCNNDAVLGAQFGKQSFSLRLPDSIKAAGATLALSTSSLLHKDLPATVDDEGDDDGTAFTRKIGSLVSTISLRRWDGEKIKLTDDSPLRLTFSNLEVSKQNKPSCRYWHVNTETDVGVWSSVGCDVSTLSNSTHTVCNLKHLTSFAVIMRVSMDEDPLPVSLDYITWAGCGLSISCLALMLVIFLAQRMYRADRNIIHMNLAVSLMLAQVVFLFGIDRTDNKAVCKTVGICLHFFLLATFFWMLSEGVFLLSKTTSAKTRWLRLPTFFAIGWVFPVVIVAVTAAVSFVSYGTDKRCWLTVSDGGIWAFVGPAAAVIVINICILVNVIRVFLSLKANMNKKKIERTRMALRALMLTLPLLGCTWLIGMLSYNSKTHVFAYIFVIMNSLQGVFIFLLYCVLNDEIKKGLRKKLAVLQSLSGRTSNTRASRTATGGGASNNAAANNRPSKNGYEHGAKPEPVKL